MFIWTENQELMYIVFNEYFIKQHVYFQFYTWKNSFAALQRKQKQFDLNIMNQTSFDEQEVIIVSVSEKRKEKSNGLF